MCLRCLGLVLLVWFPGVLHVQSAALPCDAPILNGGFCVPEQKTYPDGTTLTYTCDSGLKPAVEGWWATSTCHDGEWSHEPQCINETSCIPPTTPNVNPTPPSKRWYEDGSRINLICDSGYEINPAKAREAVCKNGVWSSVPVCEISHNSCVEPLMIPNAVLLHKYQEVFSHGTELQYQCNEDKQTHHIQCSSGTWVNGKKCSTDCDFDTTKYPKLIPNGVKVIKRGESLKQECVTKKLTPNEYSVVSCINGNLSLTKCCYSPTIHLGACTAPMDTQENEEGTAEAT
ncbi:complement factor H-like [Parambassis ranga]|uniref:Complement factor H-like n=1 Tax=Parambassis ranga TaxID=210632 RepID=A0A6P7K279_9TELE|nr:complement factor H-like [Parambassis ranga]